MILRILRSKSKFAFTRLLKVKRKEYTLDERMAIKAKHSKMDNLIYTELKMLNYLKSENIPVQEAQNLFRFRVGAARFKAKFGDRYPNKACPLCSVHLDTQVQSVRCKGVKEKMAINGKYSDIFKEKEPSDISQTLHKISKLREKYFWTADCLCQWMRPLCIWLVAAYLYCCLYWYD